MIKERRTVYTDLMQFICLKSVGTGLMREATKRELMLGLLHPENS